MDRARGGDVDPGLCGTCRWARVVETRRGSAFYRCGRADVDDGFVRYPRLPVIRCAGFEPRPTSGRAGGTASDPAQAPGSRRRTSRAP